MAEPETLTNIETEKNTPNWPSVKVLTQENISPPDAGVTFKFWSSISVSQSSQANYQDSYKVIYYTKHLCF